MTPLLNEALIPLKNDMLPYIRSLQQQVLNTTVIIMDTYATLLDKPNSEQEDRNLLADLKHHHALLMHSLTHEIDILELVGKPREVERYINFIDGEPVEVPKSEWVGLPEGADVIRG